MPFFKIYDGWALAIIYVGSVFALNLGSGFNPLLLLGRLMVSAFKNSEQVSDWDVLKIRKGVTDFNF